MRHGSLFSGIGGFDLAAEWMGWENIFQCEWNPFCQKVLNKNFPNSKLYEDINSFDAKKYRGFVDIISGGFPCQPYSLAGKQKGNQDERHLWPEMLRIIREVQPSWVVGENVPGLVSWNGGMVFEQVQAELETEGYEVQAFLLPACGVGAPHKRERVWIIANLSGKSVIRKGMDYASKNFSGHPSPCEWSEIWDSFRLVNESVAPSKFSYDSRKGHVCEPLIVGINDGFSTRLDEHRNSSLGNAIVPQVALQVFKAIDEYEKRI